MDKISGMSNHVKNKLGITSKRTWNTAIKEAQRQLVLAKRRVEELENTVRNWTRLRDEGMLWPGIDSEDKGDTA
jgi:hypothetical protein